MSAPDASIRERVERSATDRRGHSFEMSYYCDKCGAYSVGSSQTPCMDRRSEPSENDEMPSERRSLTRRSTAERRRSQESAEDGEIEALADTLDSVAADLDAGRPSVGGAAFVRAGARALRGDDKPFPASAYAAIAEAEYLREEVHRLRSRLTERDARTEEPEGPRPWMSHRREREDRAGEEVLFDVTDQGSPRGQEQVGEWFDGNGDRFTDETVSALGLSAVVRGQLRRLLPDCPKQAFEALDILLVRATSPPAPEPEGAPRTVGQETELDALRGVGDASTSEPTADGAKRSAAKPDGNPDTSVLLSAGPCPFPLPVRVVPCPCGNPVCKTFGLSVGEFYQGCGFTKEQADYIAAVLNSYGRTVEDE